MCSRPAGAAAPRCGGQVSPVWMRVVAVWSCSSCPLCVDAGCRTRTRLIPGRSSPQMLEQQRSPEPSAPTREGRWVCWGSAPSRSNTSDLLSSSRASEDQDAAEKTRSREELMCAR